MEALILCGGLGTRLRGAVPDRPKPMADVGGRPFLELLLGWAAAQGVARAVLSIGHKAGAVRGHFKSAPAGLELAFSEEEEPLGTAGALALAVPLLRQDPILVMNGDTFCAADLRAFLSFHREKGGLASLAAAPSQGRTDGGTVRLGRGGRVLAFEEKGLAAGEWINAGILAVSRRALPFIPQRRPCSMEREVLPLLLEGGLYAFPAGAPSFDIGTPERLEAFRAAVSRGEVEGLS